jgi:hypothetical protein
MTRYRDQGEGEIVPGRGIEIVELLERRTRPTLVALRSGAVLLATLRGWGRDIGEEWEHVYLVEKDESSFVVTSDIEKLTDPESDIVLYSRAPE